MLKLMGNIIFLLLPILLLAQQERGLLQYVNPLIGTAASTVNSALKHGDGSEQYANTIPVVTLPFAMTQMVAETKPHEQKCVSPYYYTDHELTGFRATHWLSGSCTQDYGSVTIMPITGKLMTLVSEYQTTFSHKDETSTPAYYRLNLPKYQLITEMTATSRCGILRFTVNTNDSFYIIIRPNSDNGNAFVKIDKKRKRLLGYNPVHRIYQGGGNPAGFNGYFVVQPDMPFTVSGVFSNERTQLHDSILNQKNEGAFIGFKLPKGTVVQLKIGTSFTGIEGAENNLTSEMSGFNFNGIRLQAEKNWEKALSKIQVETPITKDKTIFYTAMYHAMQHPRLYNDVDGLYPSFASNYTNLKLTTGNYYDDYSMWDTYRAQLPLIELIMPNLAGQLVQSLVLKAKEGSWLPNFPCWNSYTSAMVGDHGAAFIASAYTRGIKGFDKIEAYNAMRKNAFEIPDTKAYLDGRGRRALGAYLKYGYYPLEETINDAFHTKEQVSRTMEYAYDDYCVAMMAKGLGKIDDYNALMKRSRNYRNVFDTNVGFVNGRYANGNWYASFNPDKKVAVKSDGINFITEGTPRQYSFYAPHDIQGLIALMGGSKGFEAKLDSLFINKQYWHGNEPGQQIPFLYNYCDAPLKTHEVVSQILKDEYNETVGGLSGNDDAGQISAWYILASLGIYPVDPVSGEYAMTSPLFDKATIILGNNKRLEIICNRESKTSIYMKSVLINGMPLKSSFISFRDLMKGKKAKMIFTLTDKP